MAGSDRCLIGSVFCVQLFTGLMYTTPSLSGLQLAVGFLIRSSSPVHGNRLERSPEAELKLLA